MIDAFVYALCGAIIGLSLQGIRANGGAAARRADAYWTGFDAGALFASRVAGDVVAKKVGKEAGALVSDGIMDAVESRVSLEAREKMTKWRTI